MAATIVQLAAVLKEVSAEDRPLVALSFLAGCVDQLLVANKVLRWKLDRHVRESREEIEALRRELDEAHAIDVDLTDD